MSPEDWELFNAASDDKVHLTKVGDDEWEVAMWVEDDVVLTGADPGVETILSDGRIRLPDGREFKRVMTTAEARETFRLEPLA
jgi:hypothetical protein